MQCYTRSYVIVIHYRTNDITRITTLTTSDKGTMWLGEWYNNIIKYDDNKYNNNGNNNNNNTEELFIIICHKRI